MQCFKKTTTMFVNKTSCFWRKHGKSFTSSLHRTAKDKENIIDPQTELLFYNLYPEGNAKDLETICRLTSGIKEKWFRPIMRQCVYVYLKANYNKQYFAFKKIDV